MLPVTPQPRFSVAAMRFNRSAGSMLVSFRVVVVSGSPEDRTQRDPRIRRIWATSPRLPLSFQKSDTSESNRPWRSHPQIETVSCSQSRRASICTCIRCCVVSIAAAVAVGAYLPCQWAGRRSNPRLRFFRPPLDRLSYQPKLGSLLGLPVRCGHEKRLDVCVTPSLHEEAVRL